VSAEFKRVVRSSAVALDMSAGVDDSAEYKPARAALQAIDLFDGSVESHSLPALLSLLRGRPRNLTPQQLLAIHEIAITRLASDNFDIALELSRAAMESAVELNS
jgi:hypothetical protein